jgi:hypothetical protein
MECKHTLATAKEGKNLVAAFANVVDGTTSWRGGSWLNMLWSILEQFLSRILHDTDLVFAARCPSWIVGVLPLPIGYERQHASDASRLMEIL